MRHPTRTLGPIVGEFFADNLTLRNGDPFVPAEFQQYILDLLYELDAAGALQWTFRLIGIPRGNGKSPLLGGVADFELVTREHRPSIVIGAPSRKQAGIIHQWANDLGKGGALSDYIEVPRVREALGPIKTPHNGGILQVLSADGDLQEGLEPDAIFEDELHVFTTSKQQALHFALMTTLHKKPELPMTIITTAGSDKDSLLGEMFDAMVTTGDIEYSEDRCLMVVRDYETRSLLVWYGAPDDVDAADPAIWRACNPAPWITDESLLLAARRLPESEFRRKNLNQWVKGEDAAIQQTAYDACYDPGLYAHIPPGSEIWVGVDLGEKRDTSGVARVSPLDDGRLRCAASVFVSEKRGGMQTTLPQVEAELRRLCDLYHVRRINFDGWQMRDLAARLLSEGMPMCEFAQNNTNMVPASQATFDMIANGELVHDGDKVLRAHVLGTGGETTATGGWRFAKAKTKSGNRDLSKQNDAAIALAEAIAGYREDNQAGGDLWVL